MKSGETEVLIKPALVILVFLVSGVYFYFFSSLNQDYSPYYGDEFFYFKNAEGFFRSSTLEAAFSYSGYGSKFLGIDPHGPAYPLLYGSVSKLIGWHHLNIPTINLVIFLVGLFFLIFSNRKVQAPTLLLVVLVLGSPITLFYSVTFLPELLHLSGAMMLYVVGRKYFEAQRTKDLYAVIAVIFILGCLRNTWFFAFIALVFPRFGLSVKIRTMLGLLGLFLPFFFQHFFHEQVPNTFSGFSGLISDHRLFKAFELVFFNIKRNLYFAVTYTEGWFYTLQKIWLAGTIGVSLYGFGKNRLLDFGLITLLILMLFNVVFYKNYTWVDLRLYTPMLIFLNLGLLSEVRFRHFSRILLSINLSSFALLIPLQSTMIRYRLNPEVEEIPQAIISSLKELEGGYILVDSTLLHDFALDQLPIESSNKTPIRYILPYYAMPMKDANYLLEKGDAEHQLKVSPKKILNQ